MITAISSQINLLALNHLGLTDRSPQDRAGGLRELLGLGNSASAQVEASRYLKKWSQPDGFLDRQRVRGTWVYTLRATA